MVNVAAKIASSINSQDSSGLCLPSSVYRAWYLGKLLRLFPILLRHSNHRKFWYTAVIVAGDFNPTDNGFNPKILTKHCDFKQVIKEPTRNANILDLIFTNKNSLAISLHAEFHCAWVKLYSMLIQKTCWSCWYKSMHMIPVFSTLDSISSESDTSNGFISHIL